MRFIATFIFLMFANLAFAETSERAELANYLRELNKIDRLYKNAKANSAKDQYRFKYQHFEKDLAKLKDGIKDYLEAPKRAPKVLTKKLEPVSGDYH